jgi:hypothetical protein
MIAPAIILILIRCAEHHPPLHWFAFLVRAIHESPVPLDFRERIIDRWSAKS